MTDDPRLIPLERLKPRRAELLRCMFDGLLNCERASRFPRRCDELSYTGIRALERPLRSRSDDRIMVIRFDDPLDPRRVALFRPNDRRVEELPESPRRMPRDGTARISVMLLRRELDVENDRRIDGPLRFGEFDERIDDERPLNDEPRRMPCDRDDWLPLRVRLMPLRERDRELNPERVDNAERLDDEIPLDRPILERVPRLMFERDDRATFDLEREMPELDRLRLIPRDRDDDLERLTARDRDDDLDRLIPRELDDRDRLIPLDLPLDCALLVSVKARTQTAAIIQIKLVRVILMAVTSSFRSAEN